MQIQKIVYLTFLSLFLPIALQAMPASTYTEKKYSATGTAATDALKTPKGVEDLESHEAKVKRHGKTTAAFKFTYSATVVKWNRSGPAMLPSPSEGAIVRVSDLAENNPLALNVGEELFISYPLYKDKQPPLTIGSTIKFDQASSPRTLKLLQPSRQNVRIVLALR